MSHAVKHLVCQTVDLLVVLGLVYLGPCERDDAQGSEERLLIGNEHVLFHGLAPQVGLGVEGCPESACVGDEHDDVVHAHLGWLDVCRIVFCRELFDMFLQAVDVGLEEPLAVGLVVGVGIVEEGGERHLRVDDHLASLVEMQDDVGAQRCAIVGMHRVALRVAYDGLGVVVDAAH